MKFLPPTKKEHRSYPALFVLFVLLVLLLPTAPAAQAAAGVPKLLNFQGRLTDASDNLEDGTFYFCFWIYDAESGGSKVWPADNPTPQAVTVSNGVFSTHVGGGGNTLDADFNADSYWLAVDVDPDDDSDCTTGGDLLAPRQRITATGYAINSDTVDGIHAASTATANQLLALDGDKDLHLDTGDLSAAMGIFSGNVGIGTTDPSEKLEVDGSGKFSGTLGISGAAQDDSKGINIDMTGTYESGVYISVGDNGSGTSSYGVQTAVTTYNDANAQYVWGNYITLATFTGAADVARGIGIYNTASTGGTQYGIYVDLDDADVTNYAIYVPNSDSGDSFFGDQVTIAEDIKLYFDSTDTYIYANTDSPEDLVIGADQDIILEPDGNVGIGTTGPDSKLHIYDSTTNYPMKIIAAQAASLYDDVAALQIGHTSYSTNDNAPQLVVYRSGTDHDNLGWKFRVHEDDDFAVAPVDAMTITHTGNVGIGTTAPGGLLGLKDANTYLDVDGGNNLTFTDAVTGVKTLAELAAGGGSSLWTDGGTYIYPTDAGDYGSSGLQITDAGGLKMDENLIVDGNVGIGYILHTPGHQVRVRGSKQLITQMLKLVGETVMPNLYIFKKATQQNGQLECQMNQLPLGTIL